MAAYAALISLKNTIHHILNSSRISIIHPSPEIIQRAYKLGLQPLLEILRSSSSRKKKIKGLDAEIRDAVCEFEYLLLSYLSHQIIASSQSESSRPLEFSIDLQDLRQHVDSFVEAMKKMEEDYYVNESDDEDEDEEEDEDFPSSNVLKMVGFSDALSQIRSEFTKSWPLHAMALVGMAGIGKTALAREVCNDPLIKSDFEHIVWVKIGQKYQLKKIACDILAQVDKKPIDGDDDDDDDVTQHLCESLEGKRCLVVLDDAWDLQVWKYLFKIFKSIKGSYRILLTTRLQKVGEHINFFIPMQLLKKEESWDLLREKVFGEDSCPYQLEKAGKKIAENCDGLPLMIVTVTDLLSKAEMSLEYWSKVANNRNSSLFLEAHSKIYKLLFPSYDYLPQSLKPYFLYMGVFHENYEIPPSKLINLWAAEGFLEPKTTQTLEKCAIECLEKLSSNNLIVFVKRSANPYMSFGGCLKTCRLQSSFWQLCNREARRNKFFHALDNQIHGLEGVESHRLLCIRNNILFSIKDVYESLEDSCALSARSLLCFGSKNRYQVPLCLGLRLLRVLDALTIRFYEFPIEVLELVQLKYLALTCNENLPPSISKLWSLEFLIMHRYSSIKSFGDPSYAPIEIWDMQELKHIQIVGSNLSNSNRGACLKYLSTLLGVSAHSCTKGVLKRMLNLQKLGIRIELVPDDVRSKPFRQLNRISRLRNLTSLKCVVVNPELGPDVVAPPSPLSMFPRSLRKLHLSGLGYPWEYMNIIAKIPFLHVLKLRNYAFQGPKWEIEEDGFYLLQFLIIEDTDLVQWKVGGGSSFSHLVHLSMKNCYNLEEIDWESDCVTDYVEIVDCNPLVVECLNEIKSRKHYRLKHLGVHSSWETRKSSHN